MRFRRWLYGSMGLLSLLGLIGVFTQERAFLAFFAFAVDFEYFFIQSDEMLEEAMNRSAARAFYLGMIAVALATLFGFFVRREPAGEALAMGLAAGWAVSAVVYALSTACYGFRERWGLKDDPE